MKDAKFIRKDIAHEVDGPMCMNRKYYVDFLDRWLKLEEKENMLEECLFIFFSSLSMVDVCMLVSIFYLSDCSPMRWMSGNSHRLVDRGWSVQSSGRVIDILEKKITVLEDNSEKNNRRSFHNESV